MWPLVGRDSELAVLRTASDATGVRGVILSAAPGLGKSRLLAEAQALGDRHVLPVVQGYAVESAIPLAAAARLLHILDHSGPLLAQAAASGPTALLPSFESAARALHEMQGRLTLVVDDEQWLDDASRALVHYLVRAADQDERDLLVLCAGRPTPAQEPASARLVDALPRLLADRCPTLDLTPLHADDAIRLTRAIDPSISPVHARNAWKATGGVPLWLAMLARDGAPRVEDVVRSRVRSAGPDAAAVVGLLAVAGRPLSPDVVAGLLEWTPERSRGAFAAAGERGLLLTTQAGVVVSHDLIREAVLAELAADSRARHNGRLGEWLGRSDDVRDLLSASHHLADAGKPVLPIVRQLLASPRRAMVGAAGVAALVDLAQTAGDALVPVLPDLAALAAEAGDPVLAESLWARVSDEHPDAATRDVALVHAAEMAYARADPLATRRWLDRARAAPSLALAERVELDVIESMTLRWLEGRFDEAARCARSAAQLSRDLPVADDRRAVRSRVRALAVLYEDAMVRGDYEEVARLAGELAEIGRGDPETAYLVAIWQLQADTLHGTSPARIERRARRWWQPARATGNPERMVETGVYLLDSLMLQGALEAAQDVATDLVPLLERLSGAPVQLSMGLDIAAAANAVEELRLLTGDWQTAVEAMQRNLTSMTDHMRLSRSLPVVDLMARLGGTPGSSAARREVTALVDRAALVGCRRCEQHVRLVAARLAGMDGDLDAASALLADWDRGTTPSPMVGRLHAWAMAVVVGREGDAAQSARAFDRLDDDLQREGNVLDRCWLGLDRAAVLATLDTETAVAVLDDVGRRAQGIGATTIVAAARARQRSLGSRPWRRGPSSSPLSARELDVARLLVTGAGNAQIATALFLSRKTVERHVSNILAKVGASNRTQAAALLRHQLPADEGVPR